MADFRADHTFFLPINDDLVKSLNSMVSLVTDPLTNVVSP